MSKNMKRRRDAILQKNPYPRPYHRDTGSYPWLDLTNQITGLANIFHSGQ